MTKPKYPKLDEVNKLIEERILVSSAVTKSTPEYIIESVKGFLTQYYMIKTGLISVNEDPKALESSMLLSSLDTEDFTALLNGSLKSLQGQVGTATFASEKDDATIEEKARAKTLEQLGEMSCDAIIDHTKESIGTPRVYFESNLFAIKLFQEGYKIGTVVDIGEHFDKTNKKTLYIKKPAEIDYTQLNLDNIKGLDAWMLFDCIIKYESGFLDMLAIPEEALSDDLKKLLKKVDGWSKGAVELANNSEHNNTVFNVVEDPFKALFNAL